MDLGFDNLHDSAAVLVAGLVFVAIVLISWHRLAARRETLRRIEAARVRSGYVPLEIPTVRGSLDRERKDEPDTLPEWFIQGKGEYAVVDERPRVHLRYRDPRGRKAECIMQVEHLDLRKKIISGHGDLPGQLHMLPMHAIVSARIAETGQRFNVDFWFDAVKVARRRRGEI